MMQPRLDTHLHYWNDPAAYAWLDPETLPPLARAFATDELRDAVTDFGFDRSILVQAADTDVENQHLSRATRETEWIVGYVGWVSLQNPGRAATQLDALRADPGFLGVRELIHDQPDTQLLLRDPVRETLSMLAEAQLPLDLPDSFPAGHFPAIAQTAADFPKLTLVLDHLGKPPTVKDPAFAEWRAGIEEIAAHPNTIAKLSGLHHGGVALDDASVEAVLDVALKSFGVERLMLGSDWPMALLSDGQQSVRAQLDRVRERVSEARDPDDVSALTFGTAARVYRPQLRRPVA